MATTDGLLTAEEAAHHLGVSRQRVYALVGSGALSPRYIGKRLFLDPSEVDARKVQGIVNGRPLDQSSAWAVIWLALSRETKDLGHRGEYLAKNTRWRLRHKLGDGPLASELAALAPRLRNRGRLVRLRAHPSDLPRILEEPGVVRTGVSAAKDVGADIVAADEVDVYFPSARADELRERYLLEDSRNPNVWLRLVDEPWPFREHSYAAPVTAVALDLLDSTDERTRRAGRELLDSLDRLTLSA